MEWGSLTTETATWSARNYTEYCVDTIHWARTTWELKSAVIDVVHLTEPIHNGECLARIIVGATERYGITKAIFTITRHNATPNDVMLRHFERATR